METVEDLCLQWSKAGIGPGIVIAVSGGGDSVALALLLKAANESLKLNWRFTIAHLNHNTRGAESDADAQFTEDFAKRLDIPFVLGHWKPTRSTHFETDARQARYQWLKEVAQTQKANAVAVGHNQNDHAETILQRILRGTGLRGLIGIPYKRELGQGLYVIRPIRDVPRDVLRRWLDVQGETYREDRTNHDLRQTRARIRHDLLPKLQQEYNPQIVSALARLGYFAGESSGFITHHLCEQIRDVLLQASNDTLVWNARSFLEASIFEQTEWLRIAWRIVGWPEGSMSEALWTTMVDQMGAVTEQDRKATRIGPYQIIFIYYPQPIVIIQLAETKPQPQVESQAPTQTQTQNQIIPVSIPGSTFWDQNQRFDAELVEVSPQATTSWQEIIDFDQLKLPCFLTTPQPGDRFMPLGMNGHSKPLGDYLRSRGISSEDRPNWPVLRDQEGIIWPVRAGICHRARVTDNTTQRLRIFWNLKPKEKS